MFCFSKYMRSLFVSVMYMCYILFMIYYLYLLSFAKYINRNDYIDYDAAQDTIVSYATFYKN